MRDLLPFTVVIPLLVAALLAALRHWLPRVAMRAIALVTTILQVAAFAWLSPEAATHRIVYWLGGWRPINRFPVGIDLLLDGVSAELGMLVALIAVAALIASWHTVEDSDGHYQPLMLVFAGSMAGLCVAGDLFTMFVFFELMSVAAYALTAYDAQPAGLRGALLFAVTNSVGAFFILIGIILLYGRTGMLNLAGIGEMLATRPPDPLVSCALALVVCGFLVKGAILPFHFWLPDAHAVAPAPVSALFSGVMVELGLYGAARVYWTVFSGASIPLLPVLRAALVVLATLTMLVAGWLALKQRHVKRLLAFSTVSHSGIAWAGFALFATGATTGATIYMPGHGLVKAALFLIAGALLTRWQSVDELVLRGKGRMSPALMVIFVLAALMLSGVPPLGTYGGHSLIDVAATHEGYGWLKIALLVATILTGAATWRVAGRVFAGWGTHAGAEQYAPTELHDEAPGPSVGTTPWTSVVAPLILVIAAIALSVVPGRDHKALLAGSQFEDRVGYANAVLAATTVSIDAYEPHAHSAEPTSDEQRESLLIAIVGVCGAVGLAAWSLRRRQPAADTDAATRWLETLQSGALPDYVTWALAGLVVVMLAA